MIFRQITHDDLGCASYFVGDYDAGVAAVVDPRLEIGPYLELARYLSVEIEHILETHNHADHVSGHGRLLELPDETEVWPGHLGGSLCGGPGMDMKVSSTIGYERHHNELLSEDSEDVFVERSLATLGPQPPNFKAIVELNRGPLVTG